LFASALYPAQNFRIFSSAGEQEPAIRRELDLRHTACKITKNTHKQTNKQTDRQTNKQTHKQRKERKRTENYNKKDKAGTRPTQRVSTATPKAEDKKPNRGTARQRRDQPQPKKQQQGKHLARSLAHLDARAVLRRL
jgi:hypothetical protein